MLPLGKRPLLEVIVEQLRRAGIQQVKITTRYEADVTGLPVPEYPRYDSRQNPSQGKST